MGRWIQAGHLAHSFSLFHQPTQTRRRYRCQQEVILPKSKVLRSLARMKSRDSVRVAEEVNYDCSVVYPDKTSQNTL
jgi:hypothetical protein